MAVQRKSKCSSCPDFFRVDCSSQVVFCNGQIGKVIDYYQSKKDLLEDLRGKALPGNLCCTSKSKKSVKTAKEFFAKRDIRNSNFYKRSKSYYLFLSGKCNNKCLFCFVRGEDPGEEMSLAKIKRRIAGIKEENVVLFGGEPTFHPEFMKITRYLVNKGKKIVVSTNGIKLARPAFAKEFLKENPRQVSVSLHSHLKKTHEYLSGAKNYEETIKGIENIVLWKNNQTTSRINIVINRYNYKQLLPISKFCVSLGIDSIRFNMLSPVMRGKSFNRMPKTLVHPVQTVPYIKKALDYLGTISSVNVRVGNHPLCYFPRIYWPYLANSRLVLEKHSNYEKTAAEGITVSSLDPVCIECAQKRSCPGIKFSLLVCLGKKISDSLKPFRK